MIKSKIGKVADYNGNERDVEVNALGKWNVPGLVAGCLMTLVGVIYTGITCFRNGARAHDNAEFNALADLGLIDVDGDKAIEKPNLKSFETVEREP